VQVTTRRWFPEVVAAALAVLGCTAITKGDLAAFLDRNELSAPFTGR